MAKRKSRTKRPNLLKDHPIFMGLLIGGLGTYLLLIMFVFVKYHNDIPDNFAPVTVSKETPEPETPRSRPLKLRAPKIKSITVEQ